LALLLNGKPQANARLTIIAADGKGWRFVTTGPDGTTMLKDLSPGITCVTATAQDNFFAGVCLDVAAQSESNVSQFQMSLMRTLPHPNSLGERVKQVEESTPLLKARSLVGTVMDQVGAVMPKAEVHVYRRGSYPQAPLHVLKTNDVGRFSDVLEPGIYTIVVSRYGFAPECFAVEVAPDGKECEWRQMLELAVMVNQTQAGQQF
jgi:hypothetical protein